MRLFSVVGNGQRLDGGAMFGNCPRAVWERWCSPDAHHRIRLACRSLLVREPDGRNVLLEAGIGAFFAPELRRRYGVEQDEHVLLASLDELGVRPEDVHVIVLSHLHFDHAGGLLSAWSPDAEPRLVFSEARYVVSKPAWERALSPHARDRASFIPVLNRLLRESGRLEIVDGPESTLLGPKYSLSYSEGHTPGLMLTTVDHARGPVTFVADLIPGAPWVHLPITMGYDRFPELLIEEKRAVLERVAQSDGWLFFTHDPDVALAKVIVDDRGRFHAADPIATVRWT